MSTTANLLEGDRVGANYITATGQGNVLEEIYMIDDSAPNNYIDITYYDKKSGEVAGKYSALFIIDPARGKINPDSPDTILVTEGEFYLKIE